MDKLAANTQADHSWWPLYVQADEPTQLKMVAQLEHYAQQFKAIADAPEPQRWQREYDALVAEGEAIGKDMTMFRNVSPEVGARMALLQIADAKRLMDVGGHA